jgi:L-asparaginase
MMANRDKVALILAGGQIVFKHGPTDSETAPLDPNELLTCFKEELQERIYVVDWSRQPVCHYTLRMCGDLIQVAASQIEEGALGAVITCGTQALTEVAYYADLIWSYPQPLVFTASISHAGAPGSETPLLLTQATKAAESKACWGQGVLVCLQDKIYAGSEVVHLSNYCRNGYAALPCGPIAEFAEPSRALISLRTPRRGRIMDIGTPPARNVEILDVCLGGGEVLLAALLDGKISELSGLVISAFGGGDVPPSWMPLLRKVLRAEVPVVLASRCPDGRVQAGDSFEGSAKNVLEMGLISAGSLTPLQARIRLAVGLGANLTGQELRAYMQSE